MAGISGHTFTWKIENASYCWMQKGEYLASPTWVVEELDNTSWFLKLYPREDGNMVSLGIGRSPDCNGPADIALRFELAFLNESGEVENNINLNCIFKAGTYIGGCNISRDEVFSEKESYLCKDTLTVQCRMNKVSDRFFQTAFKVARTRIKVEKRSGLLVIENFAAKLTEPDEVDIDFSYGLDKFMTASLYSPDEWDEICGFEFKYLNKDMKYILMKTFILNKNHTMINCCETEEFRGDIHEASFFALPMSMEFLTAKQNNFLHEGALYFHFQCAYTTGISFNEIEEAGIAHIPPSLHDHIASSNEDSTKQLFSSSLKHELMRYDNFNVEIQTKDKHFAAHIDILSANSPLFRAWIENELAEDAKVFLDCSCIDCETMSRMLIFMYTGRFNTDDLDYHSAFNLYKAACSYEIINLRKKCANFFINNMNIHAHELLSFAEQNQDHDFVRFLWHYIASHRNGIYSVD